MSLMKSQYLKRKYAFRLKYGKPTTDELKSGDGQMMSDYLGLVMSLGEYKNAHRKNMQSRSTKPSTETKTEKIQNIPPQLEALHASPLMCIEVV